jgi:hypothetical protein
MKKYKLTVNSFYYVEADNEEEAEQKWQDDDFAYGESDLVSTEEVEDFEVEI